MRVTELINEIKEIKRLMKTREPSSYIYRKIDCLINKLEESLMSTNTLCNYCDNNVKYIVTRKEGTLKCDPLPVKGIQESGRIVEVYLIHDCHNGASSQILESENDPKKLWVGPDSLQGRENNRNNGEN